MNTLKTIALTSLGIAVGAALGLLTAPRSGKKTRKLIADEFDSQLRMVENTAEKKLNELKKAYNENLEQYAETGKSVLERAKETVNLN